jgi:hypothetical protein
MFQHSVERVLGTPPAHDMKAGQLRSMIVAFQAHKTFEVYLPWLNHTTPIVWPGLVGEPVGKGTLSAPRSTTTFMYFISVMPWTAIHSRY